MVLGYLHSTQSQFVLHCQPQPPLLQSTPNKLNPGPSSINRHSEKSNSTLGVMKLLHDLAIGDMINISVLVEKSYSCCNWVKVSPHTRVCSVGRLFPPTVPHVSKTHIASVMDSRECPFFLFPLEEDGSAGRFSPCLLLWASLGVASSSTSTESPSKLDRKSVV